MMRADRTPHVCRAQPEQIYRDRNSSPAEPAGYSLSGNIPFFLERRVPGRKFVIVLLALAKSGVASHPSS
jgi:hypothetical protein